MECRACLFCEAEESGGIVRLVVEAHFVVQMRTGGAAGGADFADEVAGFNSLAGLHADVR